MHRYLVLCAIVLGLTIIQPSASDSSGLCTYTGDPHVAPFLASSNVCWCQHTGWEILLQNRWVLIFVKVGPAPYVILDYVVIFFNSAGGIPCFLFGNGGPSTCPSGSGIYSSGPLSNINHRYPGSYFMNINIKSSSYGSGYRYDFYIRQSLCLIRQSTGICIKPNCPPEGVTINPPPPVIRACDTYVGAAQKRAINPVNDGTVKGITQACYNDVGLTGNPQLAETAAALIVQHSIGDVDMDKLPDAMAQADKANEGAIAEASPIVADMIKSGACFDSKGCSTSDDTPVPVTAQPIDRVPARAV